MSLMKRPLRHCATEAWYCECSHADVPISLTEKTCPHCGAAMPQFVCEQIYSEVLEELRNEGRLARRKRWKNFCSLCVACWPVTLVVLLLIGLAVFRLVAPDAFQAIADGTLSTLHGVGGFLGKIVDVLGSVFQWLIKTLGAIGRFLLMVLKGLWWLLGFLWELLLWLLGWLWTLLVLLYENLPEILGGLWSFLKWLWDVICTILVQLWNLLKLLWQYLPAILSALWEIICFLFGLLGALLGAVWNAVKGLFSLIF